MNQRGLKFVRFQLPVIIWSMVIFIASSIPSDELPNLEILRFDKLIHVIVYFIFCMLAARALRHQSLHTPLAERYLTVSFFVAVLYGLSDEFHQSFVPGRHASIVDVVANSLGAAAYVGFLWLRDKFSRKTRTVSPG